MNPTGHIFCQSKFQLVDRQESLIARQTTCKIITAREVNPVALPS